MTRKGLTNQNPTAMENRIFSALRLQELLEEYKAQTNDVYSCFTIVQSDEIQKFVNDKMRKNKITLFAFLPESKSNATNEDNERFTNTLEFWAVEKSDYSSYSNHLEWLKVFERTAKEIQLFYKYIKTIREDSELCSDFHFLNWESINFSPVWHHNNCNGYGLELTLDQ